MKKIASLILSVALASSAFAGPVDYSGKDSKVVPPTIEPGCNYFVAGGDIGLYGAGFISHDGTKSALGGGVIGDYYFCENFGLQGSYGAYATTETQHEFDGAFVFRFPIKSICVAPYALAGGGFSVNGERRGNYFAGAGLEARFSAHLAVFGDGAYHWSTGSEPDYTLVRLGVKFPF